MAEKKRSTGLWYLILVLSLSAVGGIAISLSVRLWGARAENEALKEQVHELKGHNEQLDREEEQRSSEEFFWDHVGVDAELFDELMELEKQERAAPAGLKEK